MTALTAHDGRLFAGFRPLGVLVSTDGGDTWEPSQGGLPSDGSTLFSIASRGADLFACTQGGLYRSADGGATWSWLKLDSRIGPIGVSDLTEQGGVLYAGTIGSGVYRSTDGGTTWVKVHDLGTLGDPDCCPVD